MIGRILAAFGALALVFVLALSSPAGAQEREPLTIVTADGQRHAFSIDLADTAQERQLGLMNVESIADDYGMLFDFGQTAPVSMWMKNTLLSLDMLFVGEDGTVKSIARRTKPLSTRTIPSGAPVKAVLEIRGGRASELGVKVGDRIEHPLFAAKP
ncbi:MAG TPA: DUF192 domain-containing protein [Hyphomonadaceae bacterium]|nr:DUF192 domain-containing protein [Hyphomonadaceae bacterium]